MYGLYVTACDSSLTVILIIVPARLLLLQRAKCPPKLVLKTLMLLKIRVSCDPLGGGVLPPPLCLLGFKLFYGLRKLVCANLLACKPSPDIIHGLLAQIHGFSV